MRPEAEVGTAATELVWMDARGKEAGVGSGSVTRKKERKRGRRQTTIMRTRTAAPSAGRSGIVGDSRFALAAVGDVAAPVQEEIVVDATGDGRAPRLASRGITRDRPAFSWEIERLPPLAICQPQGGRGARTCEGREGSKRTQVVVMAVGILCWQQNGHQTCAP